MDCRSIYWWGAALVLMLYLFNIRTDALTNLTNSPTVWDEHGLLSPDGKKLIWMSAYPYRNDPSASVFTSISAEFMMMNRDGTGLTQFTRFRQPGSPEYTTASTRNWETGAPIDLPIVRRASIRGFRRETDADRSRLRAGQ